VHELFVIVNPASANGSTARFWPRAEAELRAAGLSFDWAATEGPLHATALALHAAQQGYARVMYVGGDGTANEVANGLLAAPVIARPALAALPRGTGGDLPRALGLSRGVEAAIERLKRSRSRTIDVAATTFVGLDGAETRRYFVNVADAGLGGVVAERVNRGNKALGGTISFLWAIIAGFFEFTNIPMTITVDGEVRHEGPVATAIVANGRFFGGGVKVAPFAHIDDGLLDLIIVGDISKRDLLLNVPGMYNGRYVEHPKASVMTGREVLIEGDEPILLDLDGEHPGRGPFHVWVEPGGLSVLV
jgi:YegS/Rv2252/BmrU family lipid kinase